MVRTKWKISLFHNGFLKTENRSRKASLSSSIGDLYARSSFESHSKVKVLCLPAMCRLQSSTVL